MYFIIFTQVAILIFAVLFDSLINKKQKAIMMTNVLLVILLIIQNYFEYRFNVVSVNVTGRIITGIVGYSIRPVIIVMWIYLVRKNQKIIISWMLCIINFLIHLTALFSGVCFTITSENAFTRGPLGYTCHVVSGILLLYLFWLSADKYIDSTYEGNKDLEKKEDSLKSYKYGLEGLVPTLCVFLIIVAVIMDSELYVEDSPIVFLTAAVVSCSLFYYLWLHRQLVRVKEKTLV